MKTNIAKTLIESFGLVQEAADPAKVQRFIQLVNSGQMSGELIDLQRQLRPEMLSSDALAQAFSKMNGMMVDKIATNKNPQAAPKAGSDPKVLQLQKSLIAKGAKIAADGIMGPQTQTAMKQFGQKPAAPTSQPAQPVPAKTGGAAQAKPASQAFDDMPPIVPQATQPLTPQTQTSEIMKALKQLKPDQIAHLADTLTGQHQNKSFLGRAADIASPSWLSGGAMNKSDGKITPELQTLINANKKDSVSYIKDMIRLNQQKG